MKNLKVRIPTVDGGVIAYKYKSCKHFIHVHFGDDWGPPPEGVEFVGTTNDGKNVRIFIPYQDHDEASVSIL